MDFLFNPLMRLINLPSEAALPILTGMFVNIYAVIALITFIPFTLEQMTLIAVFTMIAHGLIAEGIIQHESGINIIKITIVRISAAILTTLVVSQFFGDTSQSVTPAHLTATATFIEVLKTWAIDITKLLIKILLIITAIMIILESLNSLGWIENLLKFFKPIMCILGLSSQTTMLWMTAIIFGLMYSGAIIVEEAKKEGLTKEELERLHISIGINHSMVEDPALFLVLGLNGFWLWVPKFIMAIIAVQAYRAIRYLKERSSQWRMVKRR